jgi:hypothetical protein
VIEGRWRNRSTSGRQGEQDGADPRAQERTRRQGALPGSTGATRPSGLPCYCTWPRATCKALAGTSNSSAIPASAARAPKIAPGSPSAL